MQPEGPKRDNVAVLLMQADAARERGSSTESLALYKSALNVEPDNLYALYWLATLQQELGDLAAAKGQREIQQKNLELLRLYRSGRSIADSH